MPGVEEIEHAVREHDRAALLLAPPPGVARSANLVGGAHGTESASRVAPRRSAPCSSGGVAKVVAMTTSRIALNRRFERMPAVSPICAKINPTSPRGTIPTPTAGRLKRRHGTAQPLASLPTTAIANSVPPIASVWRFSGTNG